jgi:hypothetical protein
MFLRSRVWQNTLREGFIDQDQLERFSVKREHNQRTKVKYRIINSSRGYYNLGSRFKFTKGWSPKDTSKDNTEFVKAVSLTFRTFSLPWKRMPSIDALCLRIPVRSPTLIGLDFPLTTLIGIAGKRKHILTCTEEATRAKLEWLGSARLIHGDQQITTGHAKALIKTNELIGLLVTTLSTTKPGN